MLLFGRDITKGPPIIVAEIGAGHNGSMAQAFDLIDEAKEAGADAVKIQCYEPEDLTIRSDRQEFVVQSPLWKDKTLWELYSEAQTPLWMVERMFRYASEVADIPIFASLFNERHIPALEQLKCSAYKVASFELVDIPLIKAVAATGKPVILSTGMANDIEIMEATLACADNDTVVLHAVSGYPTPVAEANLSRIRTLQDISLFRDKSLFAVGISDHTLGATVPIAATVMGATVIEKHFCLSRDDGGPDAAFSMEPHEFKNMVQAVHDAWAALQPSSSPSEDVNRKYRRSLYVVRDVRAGEPFTRENVRSIRPAKGMPPKHLDRILRCRASYDIKAGTPLYDDMIVISLQDFPSLPHPA